VAEEEQRLIAAMAAMAERHPRWGDRTATKMLRDQGWAVNEKRVERLWRKEGHRLSVLDQGVGPKGPRARREQLTEPSRPASASHLDL